VLQDLNIDDFKSKSPACTCESSPFIHNPDDHVITGDLNVINDTSLRDVFAKEPKYREAKSIYRKHNLNILMDSVEDYVRQWAQRQTEDLDTLSECGKSVRSSIQIRIKILNGPMSICKHQSLKTRMLLNTRLTSMTNMLFFLPTRPLTISFLCVNHITQTA